MSQLPEKVLSFINCVRTVQGLAELSAVFGTDPDDPHRCMLARAMNCEVAGAERPGWPSGSRFVLRFRASALARAVARATQQEWVDDEVALPDELVSLVNSAHFGLTLSDAYGFLRGWWTPLDETAQAWRLHVMPGFACPVEGFVGREGDTGLHSDGLRLAS